VYGEIRSERERIAVQYRAEGASQKATIESLADLQRSQLLSLARRDATTIRGQGEAKAIEILNAAHSKDPPFYELLKTLEAYRTILDDQTTVVLSADSPLLKLLTEGLPKLPEGGPKLPSSSDPGTGEKRETARAESEADTHVSHAAGDGEE
jgi:membrane protease subunit HflC